MVKNFYKIILCVMLLYAANIVLSKLDDQSAYATIGETSNSFGALNKLMRYGLIAYLLLNILQAGKFVFFYFNRQWFLFLLFCVAAFSTIYSVDVSRSVIDLFNVAVLFFVPMFISDKLEGREIYKIAFWFLLIFVVFQAVLCQAGSAYALTSDDLDNWRGLTGSKNSFAGLVACVFALTVNVPKEQGVDLPIWLRALIASLLFYVLYRTHSVGALLAVTLVQGVIFIYSVAYRLGIDRRILTALLPAAVLFGIAGIYSLSGVILHFLGKDLTLTGRTGTWLALLPTIEEHPFGLGYGTTASDFITDLVGQSHGASYTAIDNAYVVLALEIGWPVALIYGIWLLATGLVNAPRKSSDSALQMFLPLFLFVTGFLEKSGGPYLSVPFALFLTLNACEEVGSIRLAIPAMLARRLSIRALSHNQHNKSAGKNRVLPRDERGS